MNTSNLGKIPRVRSTVHRVVNNSARMACRSPLQEPSVRCVVDDDYIELTVADDFFSKCDLGHSGAPECASSAREVPSVAGPSADSDREVTSVAGRRDSEGVNREVSSVAGPKEEEAPEPVIEVNLGDAVIRVPAHIPTHGRRYRAQVPGGRYTLRWDVNGRLHHVKFDNDEQCEEKRQLDRDRRARGSARQAAAPYDRRHSFGVQRCGQVFHQWNNLDDFFAALKEAFQCNLAEFKCADMKPRPQEKVSPWIITGPNFLWCVKHQAYTCGCTPSWKLGDHRRNFMMQKTSWEAVKRCETVRFPGMTWTEIRQKAYPAGFH